MIRVIVLVGVSALTTGLASCVAVTEAEHTPHENLGARLRAAKKIVNREGQNDALAAVAIAAAQSWNLKIAREALAEMSPGDDRDDAAEEAALIFAKDGRAPDALAIAEMITNRELRDEVLERIATGI